MLERLTVLEREEGHLAHCPHFGMGLHCACPLQMEVYDFVMVGVVGFSSQGKQILE